MTTPATRFATAGLGAVLLAACAAPAPPAVTPTTPLAPPTSAPAAAVPTRLSVIPARVLLEQGQSLRFRAVGDGPEEPPVEWSVVQGDGGPLTYDAGSITAEGVYTPGLIGVWSFVQAVSKGDRELKAMARVQVVPRGALPIRDESTHPAARPVPDPRRESEVANCTVMAPSEAADDMPDVMQGTRAAMVLLTAEFADAVPVACWERFIFSVELLAANGGMGPGHAEIRTAWNGDDCIATVRFLAPSLHPPGGTTLSGQSYDGDYFRRTLIHEFASVALEAATRFKGKGWGIDDAPSWFVQGHEEWLAVTLGAAHGGDAARKRYREMVRADPAEVVVERDELKVRNPYLGGTVFVGFLHEEFGKEKVRALLLSTEEEFPYAFSTVFGASPAGLLDRFRAWLAK